MGRWFDWRAACAVLLALGVAALLVILSLNLYNTDGHVTSDEANLVSVLGGAAIGAVAAYLGGAGSHKDDSGDGPGTGGP